MKWIRLVRSWLSMEQIDRDLRDELQHHAEEKRRELERRGLPVDALPSALHREMGNTTQARESAREVWVSPAFEGWRSDLRWALRSLRRAPALSIFVITLLAIGMGSTLAVFDLVDRIFLRPPSHVRNAGELHRLWHTRPATAASPATATRYLSFLRARAIAEALDSSRAFIYTREPRQQVTAPVTARAAVNYVDPSFFAVLGTGVTAAAWPSRSGMDSAVTVLTRSFARRQFTRPEAAIGEVIVVAGELYTVVGLAPDGFAGIDIEPADLWIPLAAYPGPAWFSGPWREAPNVAILEVIVRQPSATATAVHAATSAVRRAYEGTRFSRPDTTSGIVFAPLQAARGPGYRPPEFGVAARLSLATALIMLIATANVGSLLIARMLARQREMAVRLALGVSAARLRRLLVLEPLLLVGLAGAAAFGVGLWTSRVLVGLLLPDVAIGPAPTGWRLTAMAAGLTIALGLGVAVMLARSVRPVAIARLLGAQRGASAEGRSHRILLGAQACLSFALVCGALAMVTSLRRATAFDTGWDVDRLVSARVDFSGPRPGNPVIASVLDRAVERVRGLAGVDGAVRVDQLPLEGMYFVPVYWAGDSITRMGPSSPSTVFARPEYFGVAGIRFRHGRAPLPDEKAVALNEAAAALFWPGRQPDACLRLRQSTAECLTITGVVENSSQREAIEAAHPVIYVPENLLGEEAARLRVLVRAHPSAHPLVRQVLLDELRIGLPSGSPTVVSVSDTFAPFYRRWKVGVYLFGALAVLALLVSALGTFANIVHVVSSRRRELATRAALGADRIALFGTIVARTHAWTIGGSLFGLSLWLAGSRVLAAVLYETSAADLGVPAAAGAVLGGALALVTLVAGLRGTLVDPGTVLRED